MINAEFLGLTANQLAKIASKLEDENTKLRKLFAGWRYCHDDKRSRHEGCPLYRETDDYSDWHNWCRMDEILRELGIEVENQ